jgi:hypothetical protein
VDERKRIFRGREKYPDNNLSRKSGTGQLKRTGSLIPEEYNYSYSSCTAQYSAENLPALLGNNISDTFQYNLLFQTQQSYGNKYIQQIMEHIQEARNSGQSLEPEIRTRMEKSFGQDLSKVRTHQDSKADNLCRELGATAFSTGEDIFFNGENYQPDTPEGNGLLAHELTHVIQQSSTGISRVSGIMNPADNAEREAQDISKALVEGNNQKPVCIRENTNLLARQAAATTGTEEGPSAEVAETEIESLIIEEEEMGVIINFITEEVDNYKEAEAEKEKQKIAYRISQEVEEFFNLINERAADEKTAQHYHKKVKGLILKKLGNDIIKTLMQITGEEEPYTHAIRRYLGVSRMWQKEMPGKWWEDPVLRKILLYLFKHERALAMKELKKEKKKISELKIETSPEIEELVHMGAVTIFAIWMLENWEELKKNKGAKELFFKENELVEGEKPWIYFSRMYEYYYSKKWLELEITCRGIFGSTIILENDPSCQNLYNAWYDVQENAAILPWEDQANLLQRWEKWFK